MPRTDSEDNLQENLEARLARAQKLEAVGQLAGGIAHDFNNVLTGILGYVELCRRDLQFPELLGEYLRELEKAAQQAAGLTRQLLTCARQQTVGSAAKDVNIDTHIRDLAHLLERLLGHNVELRLDLGCGGRSVGLERSALTQVLVNLVVNARDALHGGGGFVVIRTSVVDSEAGESSIRLSVIDSGSGISSDVLTHIFEPFFTTKPGALGTGLGLATVRTIATSAGGSITVRSELGSGAEVELLLPVVTARFARSEPPPSTDRAAALAGVVLLVEQDPFAGSVLERMLQESGYEVARAPEPRAALQWLLQPHGVVSLLICDAQLADVGVAELIARTRHEQASARVIFTSSNGPPPSSWARDDVSTAHLPKPFTPGQLLSCIARLTTPQH
jgi:CheY-like chemotaxis protein